MQVFTTKKATPYNTRAFPLSHRKSQHRGGIILQEGACLQTLQQHYPFIVSLGYQLYRTMMLLTPNSAWWGKKGSKDLDKYLSYQPGTARIDLDLLALGARDFRGVLGNTVRNWASDGTLGLKTSTADIYHILFNLIKGHHYDGLRLMLTEIREVGGEHFLNKLWMMRKGCRNLEANLLQAAVQTGSPAFVKLIVDFGAAEELVNYSFGDCELPLLLAMYETQEGDVQIAAIVELLLKAGAQADKDPEDTGTALYEAACHGYKYVVKVLVEQGKADLTKGYDHLSPLFGAATDGKFEVVKYLVEVGSPLESSDGKMTLLHAAAMCDSSEVLEYVISACAAQTRPSSGQLFSIEDILRREEHGPTPLFLACYYSNLPCVKVVVEKGGANPAAQVGLEKIIPEKTTRKKKKQERHENDQLGETALHAAAASCSDDTRVMMEYLIEKGADPKIENAYGYTCLEKLSKDEAEIVDILVGQHGLNPSRTVEGTQQYAFYHAITSEHVNVARAMMKHSLERTAKGEEGWGLQLNLPAYGQRDDGTRLTFVSVAIEDYSPPTLKFLKEFGADFNAKNSNDSTPISFLFSHDEFRTEFHAELEVLLEGGADGNAPSVRGAYNPKKKIPRREMTKEFTALEFIKDLWERASSRNYELLSKRLEKERGKRKSTNRRPAASSSSSDSDSDSSTDSTDYISQMDEDETKELMDSLIKCKELLRDKGGVTIPPRYPVTNELTDEDLEDLNKALDDDADLLKDVSLDTDDLNLDDMDSPPSTDDDSD